MPTHCWQCAVDVVGVPRLSWTTHTCMCCRERRPTPCAHTLQFHQGLAANPTQTPSQRKALLWMHTISKEVFNETLDLFLNDDDDNVNDSGTPIKGKGKATFEFQILPTSEGNAFRFESSAV